MIKKEIAILLPYKENYNINRAGAASIWIKDYLSLSKLKNKTIIYGNLEKKIKPLTNNFINIDLTGKIIKKNIRYTEILFEDCLKKNIQLSKFIIDLNR